MEAEEAEVFLSKKIEIARIAALNDRDPERSSSFVPVLQ
jgi:hypothetical protein